MEYEEIANSGIICNYNAFMFARIYKNKTEYICPLCGNCLEAEE